MDSAVQNGKSETRSLREQFDARKIAGISDLKNRIEQQKNECLEPPGFDPAAAVRRLVADGGEAAELRRRDGSVAARLQRKFGLGDQPKKRMMLFRRLEQMVERHGDLVVDLISEAVACSVGKEHPGRYFARAIVLKLNEKGLYNGKGDGNASW